MKKICLALAMLFSCGTSFAQLSIVWNAQYQHTSAPGYSNEGKSCPQFEELFKEYGLNPVKTFSYIAYRESRCRPKAVNAKWDNNGNVTWTLNKNGSIDRGLFQINSSWRTVTSNVCGSEEGDMDVLYNLDCNLRVAKYLLDNGGLGHWGM